ncbi:glycoside hydrolase family 18 [Trichoderma arundinaceum]|uniref:chitinase n=1 Tax=Trichoderma arundinaceum TaxID=490622 RepID=A0A395NQS3_TRIAR|nr:glycoside hydrolase family 18 [Trichoderma arundinaceum]
MVPRSQSWFCPCSCMGGSSDSEQEHHQLPPNTGGPPADTSNDYQMRPPATARTHMNGVYYPSWLVYKNKTPATLDVDNITHVFYAFVGVNEDGSLRWVDEHADLVKDVDGEKGALAALAKLKRQNPRLKTIVSIGGGADSKQFCALAASRHARETFARQVRGFCDRHELDGVDSMVSVLLSLDFAYFILVDWEHPKDAEEGRNYVKLLQECRNALPENDYFLTTALPVGQYILKHIDLHAVSRLVNYINLMAYDFTGSWSQVCGHHAQLHSPGGSLQSSHPDLKICATDGVEYVLSRGFPSRKLVLGIPAYGRYFPRAGGPGYSTEGAGEIDYCEMPDDWVENAVVDEAAVAAWYVDNGEKGYITFDVPRTVYMKGRYAAHKSLGGLFYWTGTGDKAGELSLVVAGRRGLDS